MGTHLPYASPALQQLSAYFRKQLDAHLALAAIPTHHTHGMRNKQIGSLLTSKKIDGKLKLTRLWPPLCPFTCAQQTRELSSDQQEE